MENLLRSCYNEMNILGANTLVFEKRENAINDILDNDILNKDDYSGLTNWIMGIDKRPEDTLIKLEKIFCKYDENFALQGTEFQNSENKEIEILCTILLYQYCINKETYEFSLKILCGVAVGYRIKSQIMEEKFNRRVSEYRIRLREDRPVKMLRKMSVLTDVREKIIQAINDETEYNVQPEDLENVLDQFEVCQQNIQTLSENEEVYKTNMKTKSEETNLLWWMVSGWCAYYQEQYRNLTAAESVLTIPFEIDELVEFEMYPYTFNQIVKKMLSETGEEVQKEYSLNEIIQAVRKELMECEYLNFDEKEIDSRIQPVLYAMKMRKNTEKEEEWTMLFQIKSKKAMTAIKMSAVDFSVQLCRELELLRYMSDER